MDDAAVRAVVGGNAQQLLDPEAEPTPLTGARELDDVDDLLERVPLVFRRCYLGLLAAVASAWAGGDPSAYYRFAEQSLEPRALAPEHRDAAQVVAATLDLARNLHAAGAREQAYAAGTAALAEALTGPLLAGG